MANIDKILSRVKTLSDDRKAQLADAYKNGSLTDDDKAELKDHVMRTMADVQEEIEAGKEMLDMFQQS